MFIGSLGAVLLIGLVKLLAGGGVVTPVVALAPLESGGAPESLWLLMMALASGCTALTGVEAISNGVQAFREPRVRNARHTLTIVIVTLAVLLLGIGLLSQVYGIGATEPGQPGYESVLSQLVGAVIGKGAFYYLCIGAVLGVLALSANTGFADFPRLCRIIAQDDFLPHAFASRGRRLVYNHGIVVLAVLAGLLLIAFGGVTDHLIPLFAVGAFLAFTLSQAGMVMHWRRAGGPGASWKLALNGFGAGATGVALLIVLVAKFTAGAWITVLVLPALLGVFIAVRRHYANVLAETACPAPLDATGLQQPVVVVPIQRWNMQAHKALRFALKLSPDCYAVQVATHEEREQLAERWPALVEGPARAAGLTPPRLLVRESPYRRVIGPLLGTVDELLREHPGRQIAVIVPELVDQRWYHYMLHNQRAQVLKALLLLRGGPRVVTITVPWYLHS